MHLYLVRHAQTAWNVEGRAQGHTDIELDECGREQSLRLAESFRDISLATVLTSDLKRSLCTAEAIADATGACLEKLAALRERKLGDWEGLPFEVLWARASAGKVEVHRESGESGECGLVGNGQAREQVVAPNGESIAMVWDRLAEVEQRLRNERDPVLVVTHGGTGSLLLSRLLSGTIDTARAFRFANASVTELRLRPDGHFMIARYNDTSHLADLPAREGSLEGSVP